MLETYSAAKSQQAALDIAFSEAAHHIQETVITKELSNQSARDKLKVIFKTGSNPLAEMNNPEREQPLLGIHNIYLQQKSWLFSNTAFPYLIDEQTVTDLGAFNKYTEALKDFGMGVKKISIAFEQLGKEKYNRIRLRIVPTEQATQVNNHEAQPLSC